MSLPNKITLTRILLIPIVPILFLLNIKDNYFWAGLAFSIICCTDFIDGAIARKSGQITKLGKLLDPLADKIATTIGLFLLVYSGLFSNSGFHPQLFSILGLCCSIIIIVRDFVIGILRQLSSEKGIIISADIIGKVKTVVMDFAIPILFISRYHIAFYAIGITLFLIAFILNIVSLVNYIVKNKKVLSNE